MVITDLKDEYCSLPKDPLNQSKDKTGHHKVFSPLCAHFPPKRHKNSKQVAANAWFMLLLLVATNILYRLWLLFPNSLLYFGLVQFIAVGSDPPQREQFGHCAGFTNPIPAMSDTLALEGRETNCLIRKVKMLKQFGFHILRLEHPDSNAAQHVGPDNSPFSSSSYRSNETHLHP